GDEMEGAVDDHVDPAGQPAADRAGHNQGADDADRRGQYQQGTNDGGYIACGDRDRHGNLLTSRWAQRWTATVTRTQCGRLWRQVAGATARSGLDAEPAHHGRGRCPPKWADAGP